MRLSSRYKSVFHPEMYADGVRLEPASAPQLKVRWFGHSLDPEEILVERLSVRFPTLRHGQLNVVQSKNRHECILPTLSTALPIFTRTGMYRTGWGIRPLGTPIKSSGPRIQHQD